ncbi:transmembrane protein 134 isoform X4 [Notamacropus eugenii]|uniref:transmembrane protein 134 isoform X4 n=1 Tax=Notamacropus eugenii TaxID=9315 RepID=UPI003B6763F6
MSSGRSEFSIDDAFELSLEEGGPGSGGTTPRFGALHFERKGRGDAEEEGEKQSRLKYQNLENDEDGAQMPSDPDGAMKLRDSGRSSTRSSQWSFSTISNSTQRSYQACCSWTQHPLIKKNRRVVLASFLLLLLGLILILIGIGLQVNPSPALAQELSQCAGWSPACPPLSPQVSPVPSSLSLASCCSSLEYTTSSSFTLLSEVTKVFSSSTCLTLRNEPRACVRDGAPHCPDAVSAARKWTQLAGYL